MEGVMEGKAPTSLHDLKPGILFPGDKDESTGKEVLKIEKPSWYDEEQYKRGQKVFLKYRASIIFAYLCAILVGFTVDQLTNALIFTGLSVGPAKSRKRYMHTLDYLIKWQSGGDIFDPNSVAGTSILKVRHFHHYVRKEMSKKAYEELESVLDEHVPQLPHKTLPMNQYDMALVQSGFIGPILIQPKEMGMQVSPKELDDYTYLWRVIGWCLGMRDEFNMCGRNARVSKTISDQVEREIIIPGLCKPTPHFTLLCNDFVSGLKWCVPGLNKEAMYKYMFPRMGLKPPHVHCMHWFFYILVVVSAWLCYHISPARCFYNVFMKHYLRFAIWLYAR